MTETTAGRRAVSEITRADYRAVTDAAYSLHSRINGLMDRLAGPEDPAWKELYELMQLANVLASAAGRYAERAGLPREPVDGWPAAGHGQPGHRYDAMTCGSGTVVPF